MAPRRPINSDYTRQVAEQGMAAVTARRQGAMYDPTNYAQALTHLAQTGYGPSTSAGLYGQWMQSRGFNPTGYAVTVGQSASGKYGGFNTLGMLQSAIRGQAETMRQQDQQQADELAALASKYLDQAQAMYGTQQDAISASIKDVNPAAYRAAGFSDAAKAATAPGYKAATDRNQLNQWLGDTTDPYLSALELASQINQTPIRNYATVAGANYGVDPNLVAGWYPESSDITDYRQQRDLQAIQNYGMTQSDYEQWLAGQQRDVNAANNANADQQDADYLNYIYSQIGLDGKQVAQNLDVTVPQLASLMSEPDFQTGYAAAMQALQNNNGGDTAAMQQAVVDALAPYANDPTMYGALSYLFSQYLP